MQTANLSTRVRWTPEPLADDELARLFRLLFAEPAAEAVAA